MNPAVHALVIALTGGVAAGKTAVSRRFEALEAIIHPLVRNWLHQRAVADRGPYCLLAIPLLAENIGHYRWVDRILVVDAPESVQIQRLLARDGIDEDLARRMIEQQATRAERLALADDVLENSGDESALDDGVAELHQRYLALARRNL
jgi:dephospho-CoA kinase